jgi:hypothetical protein
MVHFIDFFFQWICIELPKTHSERQKSWKSADLQGEQKNTPRRSQNRPLGLKGLMQVIENVGHKFIDPLKLMR